MRAGGIRNPDSLQILYLLPFWLCSHCPFGGISHQHPNTNMNTLEPLTRFAGKTHSLEAKEKIAHARLGTKHTAQTRAKMSANSGRKRPVVVNDVTYESVHAAALALGLRDQALLMRIKRNTPGYAYAEL